MNDFKRKLTPAQVLVTFALVLLPVMLIFYFVWNGYKLEDFTTFQKVIALIAIVFIYFVGNHFLERGTEKPPINWLRNPVAAVEYAVATKKRFLTRVAENCLVCFIVWLLVERADLSNPIIKSVFLVIVVAYTVVLPSIYLYVVYKKNKLNE